jgi:hypothetical protein
MTDFSRIRITQSDQPPGSGAVRLDNFPPVIFLIRRRRPCRPSARPSRPRSPASCGSAAYPAQAETAAFQIALIDRLNSTHPDMPSDRCAYCSRSETPDAILLPIGVSERHAWLHDRCWEAWRARRREAAIRELAAMGVAAQ